MANTVAKKLAVPMDVVVVRKVQIPWNTEAGFGALTWDGEIVLNEPLVRAIRLDKRRSGGGDLENQEDY